MKNYGLECCDEIQNIIEHYFLTKTLINRDSLDFIISKLIDIKILLGEED